MSSNNALKIFFWILGFVGLSGVAIFWNIATKPWINFSISSISFGENEYQELTFRNTSQDINTQGELEIPISGNEDSKNKIEKDSF